MKKIKKISICFMILFMLLFMTACGHDKNTFASSKEAQGICGSWAYIHDKDKAVAVFQKDNTAKYEGKEYTFEYDSQFIKLKDKEGGTKQLRYKLDDKGMYLYSNNTYTFSDKGEPTSLVGKWVCADKNWSYTFTETGTFLEDGYFPGNYTVDDKNSTFKLVYKDQFEDTVCYFRISGNQLSVEYPWQMVRVSTK